LRPGIHRITLSNMSSSHHDVFQKGTVNSSRNPAPLQQNRPALHRVEHKTQPVGPRNPMPSSSTWCRTIGEMVGRAPKLRWRKRSAQALKAPSLFFSSIPGPAPSRLSQISASEAPTSSARFRAWCDLRPCGVTPIMDSQVCTTVARSWFASCRRLCERERERVFLVFRRSRCRLPVWYCFKNRQLIGVVTFLSGEVTSLLLWKGAVCKGRFRGGQLTS
jgi:hypothetical protein